MPRGFSFQNDIAPMRGSFFQSGLSSREGSYLAKKYGPDMDDVKDMLSIQSQMASIRNSDLAYQNNLETLHQRREENQRKRDQDARLGQISNNLLGLAGGEGSPSQRNEDLATYRLENPELFSTPAANNLYSAAISKVNAEQTRIAKEQASKDKQDRLLRSAIEAGNVAAVTSRAKSAGLDEEQTSAYIQETESFRKSKIDQARQAAAQTEVAKFETRNLSEQEAALEDIDAILESAYIDDNILAGEAKLSPKSRRQLELQIAKFTGKKPSEIRKQNISAEDLMDSAEGYRDQLNKKFLEDRKAYRSGRSLDAGYSAQPTQSQRPQSTLQSRTGL